MSDDPVVRTELDASVLTVTLDSPANRNALSSVLVAQVRAAFDSAADDAVRAVVLTHTGGTFCAGADLGEALRRGLSPEEATEEGGRAMVGLIRGIVQLDKPVVVVADGHVRAGGLGLVAAADVALAGPSATFALTESRLGLAPSIISIPLLAKMTARAAGRYFLTGERFDADVAARIGVVTSASATTEELDADLNAVLEGIRKASPQGLAASKRLTTAALLDGFDEAAAARAAESAALFGSDEAREGMTAFLGKRRPEWDTSRQ
ncbi:enoyl-CoA hydratase family protein [Gordonia shandongensis]|uniref:enoyl-CoA hydratase family protein n=1 Tax=Gordonia shandongensis TaxID=376351 RepID=UPI000414542D|nr:enoyl-CoA hydratase family protein [Gordonia shandongensis]